MPSSPSSPPEHSPSSLPEPVGPEEAVASKDQFRALAIFVIVLGVLATFTLVRFLAPVIIAAWFAGLTANLRARLAKRIGGRHRVAALATAALVVMIVAPVVLVAVPLVDAVVDFVRSLSEGRTNEAFQRVVRELQGGGAPAASGGVARRIIESGQSLIGGAADFMRRTFSTVSIIVTQLFLLAVCAYYFSAEGVRIVAWMERGSPLAPSHFRRLEEEFMTVARAMLAGELLMALTQGIIAGITYALLGVPSALLLGAISVLAALIPTIGSAIVWVPVAITLAATGRRTDALILTGVGLGVIATVDNLLRPYFARIGADKLHPLMLFLGIFGGLEAFGGWGIILGPLIVALFVVAFRLYARENAARRGGDRRVAPVAPDGG